MDLSEYLVKLQTGDEQAQTKLAKEYGSKTVTYKQASIALAEIVDGLLDQISKTQIIMLSQTGILLNSLTKKNIITKQEADGLRKAIELSLKDIADASDEPVRK